MLVHLDKGASGVALLAIEACSEIKHSEYREVLFLIFEYRKNEQKLSVLILSSARSDFRV
jgi:hypothetical protein